MPKKSKREDSSTNSMAALGSRVTIVDIARACGVSASSVSRVFTGPPGLVKASKRLQILEAAEALGYRPNQAARRLVTQKSHLLGFIASDLRNTAYLEYFHTVERSVRGHGYEFLIADSEQSPERERANIDRMIDNRVDGLMVLPVSDWIGPGNVGHLERLHERGPACVLFGHLENVKFDAISTDESGTAEILVDHLYKLGHRRFGYIGISTETNRPASERLDGVKAALTARGIRPSALRLSTVGVEERSEFILGWLRAPAPPTALICVNDHIAMQLLRPLHAAGFSVPAAVSLCAFGRSMVADIAFGDFFTPSLTVVANNNQAVAEGGASLLLERLGDLRRPPRVVRVPGHLLIQESTGPARRR